jgi:hypothetical protein
MKKLAFGLLLILPWSGVAAENSRLATLGEIQMIFDLATFSPGRIRVVATVSSTETKWTPEQIAAEIKKQNELYPDLARLPDMQQRARSNAIAQSHGGLRIVHVQEWYSAGHYRLDQTDEGLFPGQHRKDPPGVYRNSFINFAPENGFPYRSAFVDHKLKNAQFSKSTTYSKHDLWRALGLEAELAFPLLVALADSQSWPQGKKPSEADLSLLKMSPARAEQIHRGVHPIWQLKVIEPDENSGLTRFTLRGKTMSLVPPHEQGDMEFVYEIKQDGQGFVCVAAALTNFTSHTALSSKRENFDNQGLPRVWRRILSNPGSPPKHVEVVIQAVELDPAFKTEEIFSTVFPTNYVVSDVTAGPAVVLQQPTPSAPAIQPLPPISPAKRMMILGILGLTALGFGLALFRAKHRRA